MSTTTFCERAVLSIEQANSRHRLIGRHALNSGEVYISAMAVKEDNKIASKKQMKIKEKRPVSKLPL